MRTEDGWLGYAHSRYSKGDYYVSVRLTKSEKELLDEYIEHKRASTGIHLPSVTISGLAIGFLRQWKYDNSKQSKRGENE